MTRIQTLPQLENADDTQVSAYLDEHPELVAVLNEAVGELSKDFPEERFRLDVENDMEDEEGTPYLVCTILTHRSPDQGEEALNRFNRRWWRKVQAKEAEMRNELMFGVGYVGL